MAQEDINVNTKPTKAAKDINKKARKYPLRTDNAVVDRATAHQ